MSPRFLPAGQRILMTTQIGVVCYWIVGNHSNHDVDNVRYVMFFHGRRCLGLLEVAMAMARRLPASQGQSMCGLVRVVDRRAVRGISMKVFFRVNETKAH